MDTSSHGINGDPLRGLFMWSAIEVLIEWYALLRPPRSEEMDPDESLSSLVLFPWYVVMFVVSRIPWAAAYALSYLTFHEKQRAEYFADYLAATIDGRSRSVGDA